MTEFTQDWFSNNLGHLPGVLAKFKNCPDVHAIEIGCFEGRATLWFMENILTHPSSGLVCIDTFEGGQDHQFTGMKFSGVEERFRHNTEKFKSRIRLLKGRSEARIVMLLPLKYSFIYVDGSHVSSDVLMDAVASWRLLKPGGVMIFDDYEWPGHDGVGFNTPRPGIDSFLDVFKGQYREVHRGYQIAIEKNP